MKELWQKKITKIGIAVIILAVAVGIISINVRSAQRQREYDGHVNAAEKYLTELNYEQAIAEYTLALEIEPNNEEVLNALEQTYLGYGQSLADAGDYEKAVSVLEEGYAQTGSESLREKMEEVKKKNDIKHIVSEKEEEMLAVSRIYNRWVEGRIYISDEQVKELCRPLVSMLEEYKAIFPDDYMTWGLLSDCYYLLGEYELCLEIRQQYYELRGRALGEVDGELYISDYDKYGREIRTYKNTTTEEKYETINEYGENGKLIRSKVVMQDEYENGFCFWRSIESTYEYDIEGRLSKVIAVVDTYTRQPPIRTYEHFIENEEVTTVTDTYVYNETGYTKDAYAESEEYVDGLGSRTTWGHVCVYELDEYGDENMVSSYEVE